MERKRCKHGHDDAYQGCTCWSGILPDYQPRTPEERRSEREKQLRELAHNTGRSEGWVQRQLA